MYLRDFSALVIIVIILTLRPEEAAEIKRRKIRETDCECGIRNPDHAKIELKGTFAEDHAWPWMASIVNISIPEEPVAYCGATLINDRYVLTAAHCIPDMEDTGIHNFRVYLGTNYIAKAETFLNLAIRKILSHPKFDFETADNDVCLIKLSRPVTFTENIRPICLRQSHESLVGDHGVITGWGSYNLSEPTEDALKEAKAIIVTNEICAKNYSTVDIPITDNMICASLNGEDDPCKGDSGGPLQIALESETYTQIGIISHGQGCSTPDYPSIFTRVSKFIDWIQENTQDGEYCYNAF